MQDKNIDKPEIKTCVFLSISVHNLITNKFPFATDITNLYRPWIWLPKLCAPIIDKTISKLLYNSLRKIAVAYLWTLNILLHIPVENCLPLFYITCGYITAECSFPAIISSNFSLCSIRFYSSRIAKQSFFCQMITN